MKIYLFDDIEDFDYAQELKTLPPERKYKVLRYSDTLNRNLSAAVYLLLKFALRDFCKLDTVPDFSYGVKGKPYFKEYSDIHFNLSHCNHGAACAIAKENVGVDIQDVRTFSDRLAKRVLHENELRVLQSSDNKEREFAKLWSRKESYIKRIGTGLSEGLITVDTTAIDGLTTFEFNDYFVSVCGGSDNDGQVKVVRVPALQFTH